MSAYRQPATEAEAEERRRQLLAEADKLTVLMNGDTPADVADRERWRFGLIEKRAVLRDEARFCKNAASEFRRQSFDMRQNLQQRISELEAENANLRAQLAKLTGDS